MKTRYLKLNEKDKIKNRQCKIELQENPSTGYTWTFEGDESIEVQSKFVNHYSDEIIGGGGTKIMNLNFTKSGPFDFKTILKRPWEEEALEEVIYHVEVD